MKLRWKPREVRSGGKERRTGGKESRSKVKQVI